MADPRRRLSQTGKVHISWEDSHIFNLPGWIADSYLPPTLYYSIVKATNLPDAVAYRDLLPNSYLAVFKRFTRLCAGSDAFSTLKDDRVEPEFAAEYKELLRGFFTPVNADKNPESLPFAWSRPDAGNLLCRVRYELMSVPAYTSYLNVPGILADIFAFFDALLPEMLQRFPGKLDVEEVGPGKMQRGTRLLATQVLLDLADSHDQDRGFLEDVARMMRKCSATSGVHYHLAGYDPGTLFGLCLASQLKEQRHTPECTML
ncbi:hypothetical protein KEM52_003460 [Ascosphaera acerosa]|nr:hypothetical protein KEM52_003460 [Ascosphaera acerosa]